MNAPAPALAVMEGEPDRRRYLGGSDAAAIMGLGAYDKTPLTVYIAKTQPVPEAPMDPDKKRFLERRKRWEGPIVEMLREEFDGKIVSINQRYIDPEHDFIAAEIDFEWEDADGSIQNGEIKTVSPFAFGERSGWGEAGTSDIPVHYAAQVMHGLMVTGRRKCIVAAMVGLDSMLFYQIERDEETIAALRAAEVSFWHDNVLARVQPEPQTMTDLKIALMRAKARPAELSEEMVGKLHELKRVRDSAKSFAETAEEITVEIGRYVLRQWGAPEDNLNVGEDAALMFGDVKVASWNKQGGAYLDQKRLKEEKPDIVSEYMVPIIFRVLKFTKPKKEK